MLKKLSALLVLMLLLSVAGVVHADYTTTAVVDGKSGPWVWNTTLNAAYTYGGYAEGQNNANLPPAIVSAPLPMTPGDILTITWQSGLVCGGGGHGAWCGVGFYDANGNPVYYTYSSPASAVSTPAEYIPSAQFPVAFMELMGAFADSTGSIVGNPFVIGNSATVTIPFGAIQLQMGFIDGWYNDNMGSLTVKVTETTKGVPEPATMLLLGLGIAGLAGARRFRK